MKKVTTLKDFKAQAQSGALGKLADELDLDGPENNGEKPMSLDEFLNTKKDGAKRLEDDVSVDSSMDENVREIITSNKKLNADELFAVNSQLYKWLVKRAEKVLKRKGRGYDRLARLYEKKRMQDPDYVEINRVEYLGERGTFSDVNKETADVSWRSTVVLHGPAYRRKREKYLKNRPPKVVYQVSAAEEERVAEEKKTISQWNLFLKNNKLLERGFPPEVPETKAQRLERERREWEEEKVVLRQQGEFKLTRDPVDELQLKASLVDWDYGIYRIWDILKNPLPGVGYQPETGKASRGVIRVESDYQKHALVNLHSGSIFHRMEGDVGASYKQHYQTRKLAAAELYVLEEKIRAAQEALQREKERARLIEEFNEQTKDKGDDQLSKRQKKIKEQLFQQAVDRQIWRGKGSSKEVARQIYQDLKQLRLEQQKEQDSEEEMPISDTIAKGSSPVGSSGGGGCCPSCITLQMDHETRMMNLRRRWWHTKGVIRATHFQHARESKKRKQRRKRKASSVEPVSELTHIRGGTEGDGVPPIRGALEEGTIECVKDSSMTRDGNGMVHDISEDKKAGEQQSPRGSDQAEDDTVDNQDNQSVEGGAEKNVDSTTHTGASGGVDNNVSDDSQSPAGQTNDTENTIEPPGDTVVPSPSRLNSLAQMPFSPLRFIGAQQGNMNRGVKSGKMDLPVSGHKGSVQLPPLVATKELDGQGETTVQDRGFPHEDSMDEVRQTAKKAMEANETAILSRVERTNKKLSKKEASELIQELARKRGERQLKSVLGRQKGMAHAVALAEAEGSGEVVTGPVVDVEEDRALRLEKMRRKQVFALDKKHTGEQRRPNPEQQEEADEGEDGVGGEEDKDKPEEGTGPDEEELDENITGKKAANFFEKYKAFQKNRYTKKSIYSSRTRREWGDKFKVDREDRISTTRPTWMNMSKDKKLIAAIIKSHHQYIKARDEQELRCLECCCCCTCCCCMRLDDIPDRYVDRKSTIADLMEAVNDQDIYAMLDLIYHPNYPVSVNDVDNNGESPLYRVMTETMQNAFEEIEEDDGDALIFKPSPFWVPRKMKKKATKMRGKKEWVIKILIYAGADVNFISHTEAFEVGTLLHFAVEKQLFAYVEWLVENRECNVITYTTLLNRTPLMIACLKGHCELVMYLLQHGSISVLNQQDKRGWSALHFAAGFCDPITVKALLIAGADKYARNNMGRVPVDEGLSRGKQENVNILLTHNAFDPIKESIDRLNHLKTYHDSGIDTAIREARYNMRMNLK